MKKVLYDENKLSRKKININSSESVDNLIKHKNLPINFNFTNLKKYFTENSNGHTCGNNFITKTNNMSTRTEKKNFLAYLTEKNDSREKNYYSKKREKIFSQNNQIKNCFNPIKKIKSTIININKIKDKENNSLNYSYKQKIRNIPHNSKTFKKIEINKLNNENSISYNNFGSFKGNNLNKKSINRINFFNQLTNKFNNSINIKISSVPKLFNNN